MASKEQILIQKYENLLKKNISSEPTHVKMFVKNAEKEQKYDY